MATSRVQLSGFYVPPYADQERGFWRPHEGSRTDARFEHICACSAPSDKEPRIALTYQYIEKEILDGISTVRFRDPNDDHFVAERHPMHRELCALFPDLASDAGVRGVVLAGGSSQFLPPPNPENLSALLDAEPDAPARLQAEARDIVRSLIEFPKPLVSAVSSPVVGFGPQLTFLSDAIISTNDAYFCDTHVRFGLTAGDGGVIVWPLLFGLARARRHLLLGERLPAAEAYQLGAIAELVEPREVVPRAHDLAARLAALPATAFRTTKASVAKWFELGSSTAGDLASAFEVLSYASDEFTTLLQMSVGAARTKTAKGSEERS